MAGISPRYDICRRCQERFPQTDGPGRKKEYCSVTCRQKAQRERNGRPEHLTRSVQPLGRRIAEDLQALAAALLEAEYDGRPLGELLRYADDVVREVECYTAAAVQDARNQGTDWNYVAAAARVSATTARTRWSESRVEGRLKRRAEDRVGVRQPPGPEGTLLSQASERASSLRLASALSYLHRSSLLTIKEVAERTSLSPSYVSRILSGERTPTWPVVRTLVDLFGGEPAELKVLFESAHGLVPPPRQAISDAVARLRAALQGLHLAAGRPQLGVIRKASRGTLRTQTIGDILSGQMVPDWEQASALVTALGGSPADIRPLWETIHYAVLYCLDPVPTEPQRLPPAFPESP